jgi:predicted nucleic acid-binding protein
VVPLCVLEPVTGTVRKFLTADSSIVVWWGTRTECVSAIARRRREGQLANQAERQARRVLRSLADVWSEVLPSESIRARTERLLAVHPLRAADACQLAAALLWSRGESTTHTFVCFDERLREAALREGFQVPPD